MSTARDLASTRIVSPKEARALHDMLTHADDGEQYFGWTRLAKQNTDTTRWHAWYRLVLRDPAGDVWGLAFGEGLTENQEDELPWERGEEPVKLVRLYPHTVTRVEWRDKPAGGEA